MLSVDAAITVEPMTALSVRDWMPSRNRLFTFGVGEDHAANVLVDRHDGVPVAPTENRIGATIAASQQVAGSDCRDGDERNDETNDDGAADQKVWNTASFVVEILISRVALAARAPLLFAPCDIWQAAAVVVHRWTRAGHRSRSYAL
jgi:hypothetical protein